MIKKSGKKFLPNINFLHYFYSAGKNQSISKAAEENFVTQSAISQGIDKLEIEVGKRLISSSKNRFQLTGEGELLMEKCEGFFSYLDEIEDLFNEKEGIYKGKLLFGTSHSFALSLLPSYYKKLLQFHHQIEPILRLGHSGIIREWVVKGEIEFGIVQAKEEDYPLFNVQMILEGELHLYEAKKKHKSKMDCLLVSEDRREDHLMLEYMRKTEQTPLPVIHVLSWEVIAKMIEESIGIGMLPDYVANSHGLVKVATKMPKMTYRLIAISSKKKDLTRNAKMFINLMQET